MAHFNPFSGPRVPAITALFNSCLAGQTATVNNLMVAILFHAGAFVDEPVGIRLSPRQGWLAGGMLQVNGTRRGGWWHWSPSR
jgi:hypothetical protein